MSDEPLLYAKPIELVEVEAPAYPSGEMEYDPGDDHHDVSDVITEDVFIEED